MKSYNFKKEVLGMVVLMALCFSSFGQKDTYEIVDEAGVLNISEYKSAMDKANFDIYRYFIKDRVIEFDTGVKISLYSVENLKSKGLNTDEFKANAYSEGSQDQGVWRLKGDDFIIYELENLNKKTK